MPGPPLASRTVLRIPASIIVEEALSLQLQDAAGFHPRKQEGKTRNCLRATCAKKRLLPRFRGAGTLCRSGCAILVFWSQFHCFLLCRSCNILRNTFSSIYSNLVILCFYNIYSLFRSSTSVIWFPRTVSISQVLGSSRAHPSTWSLCEWCPTCDSAMCPPHHFWLQAQRHIQEKNAAWIWKRCSQSELYTVVVGLRLLGYEHVVCCGLQSFASVTLPERFASFVSQMLAPQVAQKLSCCSNVPNDKCRNIKNSSDIAPNFDEQKTVRIKCCQ